MTIPVIALTATSTAHETPTFHVTATTTVVASKSHNLSGGAIAGIAVGSAIAFIGILAAIIILRKKPRRSLRIVRPGTPEIEMPELSGTVDDSRTTGIQRQRTQADIYDSIT